MPDLTAQPSMHFSLQKTLQAHPWGLDSGHPWPSTLLQTAIHTFQNLGLCLLLFISFSVQAANWQTSVMEVDDTELTVFKVLPVGEVQAQILWIPSEYGILTQEKRLAEQLAEQGVATTFFDPFEALFLAPTSSALQKIPAGWISKLLEQNNYDYVIAGNQAGTLALSGLNDYFQQSRNAMGLILLNPDLLTQTPLPGEKGVYWPQVAQSNFPVFILQTELSPWRWQLPALQTEMGKSGSDVFMKVLPKVRDRFYFRSDANEFEQNFSQGFVSEIQQAMQALQPHLSQNRQTTNRQTTPHQATPPVKNTAKSLELQPYQGEQNLTLRLPDTNGKTLNLNDYQGKVVLVNFWASWCPPCVHEMPSMAALKSQLGEERFEILAVNLGESKADIATFMQAHPLNFPVLLDETGQTAKSWKVMAYPSSFVIDKAGKIRYALFGATDWQDDSHVKKLNALLAE